MSLVRFYMAKRNSVEVPAAIAAAIAAPVEEEEHQRSGGQCDHCMKQTDSDNMRQMGDQCVCEWCVKAVWDEADATEEYECSECQKDFMKQYGLLVPGHNDLLCYDCADAWHRNNWTVACDWCNEWLPVSEEHPTGHYTEHKGSPLCEDCYDNRTVDSESDEEEE